MGIDINYQPPRNTVPEYSVKWGNGNDAYWWWCQYCNEYHTMPWCPNWDYDESFADSGNINPGMLHICPHCGQVMWK